jgi:hypothetical protein
VLGFQNQLAKSDVLRANRKKYQETKDRLQQSDPAAFGKPDGKGFGDELDFLALNSSPHARQCHAALLML